MKYPGDFILNEIGSNKELANAYGVSERTIYRWKNKARIETGERKKKPTRPRLKTLETFKGTRKQLAKKYGVSERTAYRWLKQAREQGADIKSRQKASKYPGVDILDEDGTNKELAAKYNVSESTIKRWKRRALSEDIVEVTSLFGKQGNFEDLLHNGPAVPEFFDEIINNEPIEEPFEVPDIEDLVEVEELPEYSDAYKQQLDDIINMLDNAKLIDKDSTFNDLDDELKQIYINDYIQYQWDENPYQFNQSPPDDPNGPDISDPEKISNINIWGAEFETWLKNQLLIDAT